MGARTLSGVQREACLTVVTPGPDRLHHNPSGERDRPFPGQDYGGVSRALPQARNLVSKTSNPDFLKKKLNATIKKIEKNL